MGAISDLTTVELFAGIGGFRIACDNLGIETIWANDINPDACGVYRHQFGSDVIVEGDICKHKAEIPNSFDILTAGFPCQPFSSAGKKMGVRDTRGTLFREIYDVIEAKRPKAFLLENVKRLLSMQGGEAFRIILSTLSNLDYSIEWRLVNARSTGLPQNRERVLIAGIRTDCLDDGFMLRMRSENGEVLKPPINIDEVKGSFNTWGRISDGKLSQHDFPSKVADYGEIKLQEVLQSPDEIPDRFDFTESTLKRIGENTPRNKFVHGVEILSNQEGGRRMGYTIFGVDGIAPTLTATTSRIYERYRTHVVKCRGPGFNQQGRPVYVKAPRFRILTNVEYARLQGFSDNHCEYGKSEDGSIEEFSVHKQYPLYGNAVPHQLVEWGLERVINNIKGIAPTLTATTSRIYERYKTHVVKCRGSGFNHQGKPVYAVK